MLPESMTHDALEQSNWERWGRQAVLEFAMAILAFTIVLPTSLWLLQNNPDAAWRVPVAIAPVLPILFVVRAMLRAIRRMGELEQRIHAEALVIGFWGSAVAMFSYGFLVNAGFPQVNWTWTWPVMVVIWAAGVAIASWRYR